MRLLITRPEPECTALAARLDMMGHEAICAPLLTIEWLPFALPANFDGLVFSSANAVRALAGRPELENYKGRPAITVGAATAEAVRAAGFKKIVSAAGDIGDLGGLLLQEYQGQKANLVHLAGVDRAGDLGAMVDACGLQIETIEVYKAEAEKSFPEKVEVAMRDGLVEGCILMSPRTASIYTSLVIDARLVSSVQNLTHYCLSPNVARQLDPLELSADCIRIAPAANLDALLARV